MIHLTIRAQAMGKLKFGGPGELTEEELLSLYSPEHWGDEIIRRFNRRMHEIMMMPPPGGNWRN